MFRPSRILQVAVASFLLSGCSTSHPEHPSAAALDKQITVSNDRIRSATTDSTEKPGRLVARGDFIDANAKLLPELDTFAKETAQARDIPLQDIRALLGVARLNETAIRLMQPSTTRIQRSWVTYRKRNVDPIRIRRGVAFWKAHQNDLTRASQTYGVPPSIIVAIIGIETVYGQYTGSYRVLDTLTTLGFRYPDKGRPERQQMFREQLADLIQLDHKGQLDAYTVEGSFAGAMGLPQFMPGSLMNFAADGDGDGKIDLQGNTADAIASVARFLRLHGWEPALPVFAPITLPAQAAALVKGGLVPDMSWDQLQQAGARISAQAHAGSAWQRYPLGVIDLLDEPRKLNEYRSATPNFFAITHYNRSYFYAAAVADLAHELANIMGYGDPDQAR
ncbi:lytic murein transglycosylase B [Alcaligenaceae bacterium CGII-47]|nr:lytic murein transglycosylase B [Alcaligenaceae bacterium CGII-47]